MSSVAAHEPFVFSAGPTPATASGADPLVHQTRREISEIVREVAVASRSERSTGDFLGLLVDRTLRALAAEGVLVWHRIDPASSSLKCVRRLGRMTDQSLPGEALATHLRLLLEVANQGGPVVVPATPGATDAEVPANPSPYPVAIVPIECDPHLAGAEYLLEAFLEPEGGVATQRGYLRFVAQMADLAGEFLRADKLRQIRRHQQLAARVDTAITQLHEIVDHSKLCTTIVDLAAELFDFDRVGLCVGEAKPKLLAVSHVNSIDHRAPAARQLCEAAGVHRDADGCVWFDSSLVSPSDDEHLAVRAVVSRDSSHRLVGLQVPDAPPLGEECRSELLRYVTHATLALRNADRLRSIPGLRFLSMLRPVEAAQNRGRKSVALTAAAIGVLMILAWMPLPLTVDAPAVLRPAAVQLLCAPRNAVVDKIHVHHGQHVQQGETLLTLVDAELEQQIITLVGRNAVLAQKHSALTEKRLTNPSRHRDGVDIEQFEGELSFIGEEIRAIDDQLAVLKKAKASLVLRADRSGFVDAWQIEQRLQSRPLQRGDTLLRVIADDAAWLADTRVPQTRIFHVQAATSQDNLGTRVCLDSQPEQAFEASLLQIGPAVASELDGVPATAVLVRLTDQAAASIVANRANGHLSGAPARVLFHCGTAPAVCILFQDLIRSVRGTVGLYLTSGESSQPTTVGERT